ncbi:MAG: hypothetical protein ACP5E4_04685, partial [Candidatus Aenigmatarchaeota archaeon]
AYDSAAATLTCDTNCVNSGDIILMTVSDSEGKNAKSSEGLVSDGTMTFLAGKISIKPNHGIIGETEFYSLDELNQSSWTIFLSCSSPEGSKAIYPFNPQSS